MASQTEYITFRGSGMDTDSSKEYISAGDSDFILNMIPNEDGEHGRRTSIRGNRVITEVDHGISELNNSYIIGGDCYDARRHCQYIFQCGDQGYDNIVKYDYETGLMTFILKENSKIGLSSTYPVFDACVIGDWLFWNTRDSSPRAINLVWAVNYHTYSQLATGTSYTVGEKIAVYGRIMEVIVAKTGAQILADIKGGISGGGGSAYHYSRDTGDRCYHTMDMYFYNYMVQPLYAPTTSYGSDTNRNSNNLRKQIFQFAYRYISEDGQVSICSPYSVASIIPSAESYNGEILSSVTTDNKLTITALLSDDDYLSMYNLAGIEILFRQIEAVGWGNWKIAHKYTWEMLIDNTSSISHDFYNDKNYTVADQLEIARAYSALPVLANAQASLMNNRIAYGGVTEGIDNITPVVSLTETLNILDVVTSGALADTWTITETHIPIFGWYYATESVFASPEDGKIVWITVDSSVYIYTVDYGNGDNNLNTLMGHLITFIENNAPSMSVTWDAGGGTLTMHSSTERDVEDICVYAAGAASFYKTKGFKTGATHKFCLFYYDALGRRSGAMVNEDTSFGTQIYLPFITENTIGAGDDTKIYKYSIDWSINHAPPDDAVYWRWGYAGNTAMTYFIQYEIDSWTPSSAGSVLTAIVLTRLQETYPTEFPNVNVEPYEFQAGDRIRVITEAYDAGYAVPYSTMYDEEIVDYDTDTNTIYIKDLDSDPTDVGVGSIVEIYRPQKSEVITYHEFGDLYNIYESNDVRYHKGQSQDQTSLQGATGTFTEGDIYHVVRRLVGSDSLYPVESLWASDFYDSEDWGKGKIGFIDLIGKAYRNNVRYSDQYIQDTKVNGLSSFQYLNYDTVTNKYGNIVGAVEVGHTLRVYCERNGISIPVGRTQYSDATGTENVIVSDKILGAQRIDADEYGTTFPESICKVGNAVYFFDARKGCFIRDTLNGAYPISGKFVGVGGTADFKMETWFKGQARGARSVGESNFKVLTGWDEEKKLLVVAFHDTSSGTYDDIICFHEPSNRWVTFLIQSSGVSIGDMPEWISKQGDALFMYLDGATWLHDNSADYCKFFGVQYGIENRVYSNEGNGLNKVYEAIAVDSNQQLSLDTIYVYNNETYQGYMQSKIPSVYFKKIEGIYRAPYLRNMLSRSTSVTTKDLFNGDFLRGKVIENRLTKDSVTSELNLFSVEIKYDKSSI